MEFLHCSRCFHWPLIQPENRLRYYLSSCGRLLCGSCVASLNNSCPCGAQQCQIVEMNTQTSKDIQTLFMDPGKVLQDSVKKISSVLQFQTQLQKNSLKIVGKMADAYKVLKQENKELRRQVEMLKQGCKQMKLQMDAMAKANAAASFHGGDSQQGGYDSMNLFSNNGSGRPNAQVPPNAHLQQQQLSPSPLISPFGGSTSGSFPKVPRLVAPSPAFNFSSRGSPATSSFGNPTFNIPPRTTPAPNRDDSFENPMPNTPRDTSPSPNNSYGTPASSISHLSSVGRGGVFARNNQLDGGMGAGATPTLITRLRNLRCRTTPLPYEANN